MESNLILKKSWLPGSYSVEYDARFKLHEHHLAVLVDYCLKHLLPAEAYHQQDVINVKGRDTQALPVEQYPLELRPKDEELAFISGKVFTSENSD